jgi:hypothetical protein
MACTSCGGVHLMRPVMRPAEAARYCKECDAHHLVREGELWIERTSAGTARPGVRPTYLPTTACVLVPPQCRRSAVAAVRCGPGTQLLASSWKAAGIGTG